jgi:aspartate/glutamate racemase
MGGENRFQDPVRLFADCLLLTGVPHLEPEPTADPTLRGKRLGLLNGASWIAPWCNYFGKLYLPGVQLVNAGNDALQLNCMQAYASGESCPPQSSVDAFVRAACDLVKLGDIDAILITCSTMNRSYPAVAQAVDVPVVQIDVPMMEAAVNHGGKVLVIATLVTTVNSTLALLRETAQRLGRSVTCTGVTVEEAWHRLAAGDVLGHNALLAQVIQKAQAREPHGCAVLAQLSMSVFALSYPNPEAEFGLPVFTSGQTGFQRMREILTTRQAHTRHTPASRHEHIEF